MEDSHHAFHALQHLEDLGVDRAFVADDPHDGSLLALGQVGSKPHGLDPGQDRLDLRGRGVQLHDDDHTFLLQGVSERSGRSPAAPSA